MRAPWVTLQGPPGEATLDAFLPPCPQELWHTQARGLCTGPFSTHSLRMLHNVLEATAHSGLHVSYCLVAFHYFVVQLWAVPLPSWRSLGSLGVFTWAAGHLTRLVPGQGPPCGAGAAGGPHRPAQVQREWMAPSPQWEGARAHACCHATPTTQGHRAPPQSCTRHARCVTSHPNLVA